MVDIIKPGTINLDPGMLKPKNMYEALKTVKALLKIIAYQSKEMKMLEEKERRLNKELARLERREQEISSMH